MVRKTTQQELPFTKVKLKLGLPVGSLNDPERANTSELFVRAGYDIKGYTPKQESGKPNIMNDSEIEVFLARPQSAPGELERGLLDAAIIGSDWVAEEDAKGVKLVQDLDYGRIRLVVAVPQSSNANSLEDFFLQRNGSKKPTICYTEYVMTTKRYFMQNRGYREIFGNIEPLVQIRGIKQGNNNKVQIINSDGVTEGYIEKGADLIVDNTQTGSTLIEHNLGVLEEIAKASAGLYVGPTALGDDLKMEKAEFIAKQLLGASIAINYRLLKFNAPGVNFDVLMGYLEKERLFLQEPTVTKGKDWNNVEVVVPMEKLPKTKETLEREYGVRGVLVQEIQQMTN